MQMYDDTMTAIHSHLIQQSFTTKMTYTSELVPERNRQNEMYVCLNKVYAMLLKAACVVSSWRLTPKQDHLVCFLGGSLMLGATKTGATVNKVSIPPKLHELTKAGQRDWKSGVELVKTCMRTHDTATFVKFC